MTIQLILVVFPVIICSIGIGYQIRVIQEKINRKQ
jgi:hypothetical protein